MTFEQFFAEIESQLPTYADDIDKLSVKMDVVDRLKKFGRNICTLHEKVVQVKNSKALLPENFKSLKCALKVDPFGCNVKGVGNRRDFTDSYIYKERIENPAYFDEVNQEYITSCNSKIITEKITLGGEAFEFYYHPQWLSITKGINKDFVAGDCLNLHPSIRNTYPHQISVNQRTINTNFATGEIYTQYYGLPVDEEGEIIIPEFTTGDIYNYLEVYVKMRIAEKLIANNENPTGIVQLYQMWKSELFFLKKNADSEAKFHGAGKEWNKNFGKMNRAEARAFNLPNLSIFR